MRWTLAVAAVLAGCAQGELSGPAAGKTLFTQAGCAACHRVGNRGSAVGPDLTLAGFRHSAQWLDLFLEDPRAWKPDSLMPNPRLSRPARKAVVEYLAELKGQDWPKGARPWDAIWLQDPLARGKLIYVRAGCVGCHGTAGRGGYPNRNAKGGVVPTLDRVAEGYSKAELIERIRRGVAEPDRAQPNGPPPLLRMPAWGETLDAAELDAVASYLLALSAGKAVNSDW